MRLAGIDGTRSGWVAVVADAGMPASAQLSHVTDLESFVMTTDFAVIDMPIGFVSGPDGRNVETAMRAFLPGKSSSVFPTPCREALLEPVYHDASWVNERVLGKRLPKQTFMLFPKMREVDGVVRKLGQARLREGHPEVSFAAMAGSPVISRKREAIGQAERARLLTVEGVLVSDLMLGLERWMGSADDVLDAAALWWSANRFVRGAHLTLPPVPLRDPEGLEMSVIA